MKVSKYNKIQIFKMKVQLSAWSWQVQHQHFSKPWNLQTWPHPPYLGPKCSGRHLSGYTSHIVEHYFNTELNISDQVWRPLLQYRRLHLIFVVLTQVWKKSVRKRCNKYLASPLDGATIARNIYYLVTQSQARLLPNFHTNRTSSSFWLRVEAVLSANLEKWNKCNIDRSFEYCFKEKVAQRNQRALARSDLWLFSSVGSRKKLVYWVAKWWHVRFWWALFRWPDNSYGRGYRNQW